MIEKMKALRNQGLTYTKIAAMVGLCRQTVKIHLRSYKPGVTIQYWNRKMTNAKIEEAKILTDEGLSYENIGVKLGVVGKTIWKHLKSYKPTPPVIFKETRKPISV
jgi:predicted transcriptional regulator